MINDPGFDHISDVSHQISNILLSARHGFFGHKDTTFARSFSDYLNADLFGLYAMSCATQPRATLTSRSMDGFLEEYEAFRNRDPVFRHLLRQRWAMDGVSLLGYEAWVRHPLARFLKSWNLQHTLQGAIFVNNRIIATLNFARRENQGPFDFDDVTKIESLCKQISDELSERQESRFHPVSANRTARISNPRATNHHLILTDGAGTITHYDLEKLRSFPGLTLAQLQADILRTIKTMKMQGLTSVERDIIDADKVVARLTTHAIPDGEGFLTTLSKVAANSDIPEDPANGLGPRTRNVLDLLVRGYSNKLIAREMAISENTVKDHVRRIYGHFGVTNRAELTWILHGYVR